MEAPFLRLGDGEEGGTDEVFCERRQDRGYARILGVHVPVEDVNLKIVEVLTAYYKHEQGTILYEDSVARAEIKAIVRQRYTPMSRTGTKSRNNVGQAVATSKSTRRNRKQKDRGKGDRAGEGVRGGAAAAKNDHNSSTKGVGKKYDDMRNKCHRCLESGNQSFDCTAHVIPAGKKSQHGSGEIVACLAIGEVAQCEQSKHGEREMDS